MTVKEGVLTYKKAFFLSSSGQQRPALILDLTRFYIQEVVSTYDLR